jgi:hypothetical protein
MWFATTSFAATIVVRSGEHPGFTRLVFSLPAKKEWQLTETQEGYSINFLGEPNDFDLSTAFDRITNQRITGIDVKSNTINIALACKCLVEPFALGNGMLVVDVKDNIGTEEIATSGRFVTAPPEPNPINIRGALEKRDQDNGPDKPQLTIDIASAITTAARHAPNQTASDTLNIRPSLEHVRTELLMQLSRGATTGVVNTVTQMPKPARATKGEMHTENIRIQGERRISVGANRPNGGDMTATGNSCLSDDQLNIGEWADPSNVVSEFADKTTGLVGEFDHANAAKISEAVRYYLSIGFGVEARKIVEAFNSSDPERAVLEALSFIVDLDLPPGAEFKEMESCNNSAALWAILANSSISDLNHVSTPAVLKSFSELPLHLRRLLGPGLAERFLAVKDHKTAHAIRDAILRATQQHDPAQAMLDARLDLAEGNLSSAENQLAELAGTSGIAGIEATVALIKAQVDDGQTVAHDLTTTAQSLLQEVRGGDHEAEIRSALALAYASQNRFDEAFALLNSRSPEAEQVWKVLANQGSDDAVLSVAFVETEKEIPPISASSRNKISQHLLKLGFPRQALLWQAPRVDQDEASLVTSAEALLSLGNNLEALNLLEKSDGAASAKLRAKALARLQASDGVEQLIQTDQGSEASLAAKLKRDWSKVSDVEENELWQEAAGLIKPTTGGNDAAARAQTQQEVTVTGPLAETRDTLAESVSTRDLLGRFLSAVENPETENSQQVE